MTYLTCVQEVAHLVGVAAPVSIGDNTPVALRFKRFADRAGQEIARRADWGQMQRTTTFTGDGARREWPLPDDFNHLIAGNPVFIQGGDMMRGSITMDEWLLLKMLPQGPSLTQPRHFRLQGKVFHTGPVLALQPGVVVEMTYVTSRFIKGSTIEHFTLNEDETYFPERLIVLNMVWRWRRAQGAPYDDELKEFEAELAGEAMADAGMRTPADQAAA